MRSVLVVLYAFVAGCTPVIDAQLRLLDQSRQGLAKLRTSLDQRQQVLESLQAQRRKQLDAAFDADVKQQATLTDAWVVQARQAYAAAADAMSTQERASAKSADTDRTDLAAVDAALSQAMSLDQAQLQFKFPFGEAP